MAACGVLVLNGSRVVAQFEIDPAPGAVPGGPASQPEAWEPSCRGPEPREKLER